MPRWVKFTPLLEAHIEDWINTETVCRAYVEANAGIARRPERRTILVLNNGTRIAAAEPPAHFGIGVVGGVRQ